LLLALATQKILIEDHCQHCDIDEVINNALTSELIQRDWDIFLAVVEILLVLVESLQPGHGDDDDDDGKEKKNPKNQNRENGERARE
jgi:hypothetical protein